MDINDGGIIIVIGQSFVVFDNVFFRSGNQYFLGIVIGVIDVYNNVWEVLIIIIGEYIVKDYKRLINDNDDFFIIDVYVKGNIFFYVYFYL